MKQKVKWIVMTMLALLMLLGSDFSAQNVEAAVSRGKKEEAKAAYLNLLTQYTLDWGNGVAYTEDLKYRITDINGDDLPEMILSYDYAAHADGWYRIYTYTNGKVKSLGQLTSIKISKNKNFFVDTYSNCGITEVKYYRLKNGKRVTLASYKMSDVYPYGVSGKVYKKKPSGYPYSMYFYSLKVNGDRTTYDKCMSKIKSIEKEAKYTTLPYEWNYYTKYNLYAIDSYSYNGNRFFTGRLDLGRDCCFNVYKINKNGTWKALQKDAIIIKRKGKYLFTSEHASGEKTTPIYVINTSTNKITMLSQKSNDYICTTDKYVYYIEYSKFSYDSNTFKIYRSKLNGSGEKAVTKKIKADYINDYTSTYVEYGKGRYVYRYYYKSGKVKKV